MLRRNEWCGVVGRRGARGVVRGRSGGEWWGGGVVAKHFMMLLLQSTCLRLKL